MKVGVLALQGAFAKHIEMLEKIGEKGFLVKNRDDLNRCDKLIIPGGESTTIKKHLEEFGLIDSLKAFGKNQSIFGTCAGVILMSELKLMDISVKRNAYGSQVHSFTGEVILKEFTVHAPFIRAPKITQYGSKVQVLGEYQNEPVIVKEGLHLAATFHPELTTNTSIHELFLTHIIA